MQAVTEYLVPLFQAKFQAVDQAISRQNVIITQAADQAKRLPELMASAQPIQAKRLPENTASQATLRQPFQARPGASTQAHQAEQQVLRLVPANASRDELKAEAIRLHDVEGLSSYKIAEKLGKPAKTVQSWLSSGKDQAESERNEAAN
jgi:DNA-directed RNA polymerase specialized sigma24 family protein